MAIQVPTKTVSKFDPRQHREHIFQGGYEHKHCAKCDTYKPLSDFYIKDDETQWDRLQPYCKQCSAEYHKVWRKYNPRHKNRYKGNDR